MHIICLKIFIVPNVREGLLSFSLNKRSARFVDISWENNYNKITIQETIHSIIQRKSQEKIEFTALFKENQNPKCNSLHYSKKITTI